MHQESGVMTPCLQSFPLRFDDLWCSQKLNDSWGIQHSFMQTATISDYNLGGAGDLFKAAEPVMEEPPLFLDPMTDAISMISGRDDSIVRDPLGVSDIGSSINSSQLLMNDVFYECGKDLLSKKVTEGPFSEPPTLETSQNLISDEKLLAVAPLVDCVASGCVNSMKCSEEVTLAPIPHFLDYQVGDFGAVSGVQNHFNEGEVVGLRKLTFLKIVKRNYQGTGTRNRREILAGKSSMLAGRLWQTGSQGFEEGLLKRKI